MSNKLKNAVNNRPFDKKILAKATRAVDDYRFANRLPSRAEAIRRLLELGLTAAGDGRHDRRSIGPESEPRGGPKAAEQPEVQTDD